MYALYVNTCIGLYLIVFRCFVYVNTLDILVCIVYSIKQGEKECKHLQDNVNLIYV